LIFCYLTEYVIARKRRKRPHVAYYTGLLLRDVVNRHIDRVRVYCGEFTYIAAEFIKNVVLWY